MVVIIAEEVQEQYGVEKADGTCQAPVIGLTRVGLGIIHHVFRVSSGVLKAPVAALSIDLHSILPNTFLNVPTCKQTD